MILVAAVCYFAARVSLHFSFIQGNVGPIWPGAGLAIVILLLGGYHLWPGIGLGVLAAVWQAGTSPSVALGLSAANVLEALAGTYLFREVMRLRPALDRVRDVVAFILIVGMVSAFIGAALGAGSLSLLGTLEPRLIPTVSWVWCLADLVGVLVVAPPLLVWLTPPAPVGDRSRNLESVLLGVLLLIASIFAFGLLGLGARTQYPYLVLPFVAWAAHRFGHRGASLVTLAVTAFAVQATLEGHGPFARTVMQEDLLVLDTFIVVLASMALVLASSTHERARALERERESAEAYRTLFEVSPLAIIAEDRDGKVIGWSAAAEQMFGWAAAEVMGRPLPTIPEERAAEYAGMHETLRRGESINGLDSIRRRKDGALVHVSISLWPLHDESGGISGSMGVLQDITERKRAEKVQLATYRISQAAHDARDQQELFRAIHGIVSELMPAKNFYIALHEPATGMLSFPYHVDEQDSPPEPRRLRRGLTEYVLRTEQPLLDRPGLYDALVRAGEVESIGTPSVDWLGVPLKTPEKTIGVVVAQSYTEGVRYTEEDLSLLQFVSTQIAVSIERKRAEDALRKSEERLVKAQRIGHVGSWEVDVLADTLEWSEETYRIFGRKPEDFAPTNQAFFEAVHPEDRDMVIRASREALATGRPYRVDHRIIRPDGTVRALFEQAEIVRNEQGQAIRMVGVVQDITERKEAEEALRQSQERFQIVAQTTNDVVWEWDVVNDYVWWNETLLSLTGYAPHEVQMNTTPWRDLLHPDDRERVLAGLEVILQRGTLWTEEYRLRRADGTYAYIFDRGTVVRDASGRGVRMIGAMMDLTARKVAEEALRQSEGQLRQALKMEAVGRLAGGVAHDFNNLLTSLLGHADLVLAQLLPADPLYEDLQEIRAAGMRAAALTQQLLAFSRKQMLEPKVIDLNAIVSGVSRMLSRLIGEDIELVTRLATDLGRTRADPGQIEQVILNLAVNARDAMREGGRLIIETADVYFDPASLGARQSAEPGPYVMIAVTDTGAGMDAETQAHLFEPFFTTKEVGKGTGLGLATVYGIVKQSGGHIAVDSTLGAGTTFRVYLPRVSDVARPVDLQPLGNGGSGSETVLVVEDEEALRGLARRILEGRGYRVLVAHDAEEALRVSRTHGEAIDLLLTDVVMPKLSGRRLAEQLAKERPDLRVLYMSGYADSAIVHLGVVEEGITFLQKPFTPDVLARRVREVLDGP